MKHNRKEKVIYLFVLLSACLVFFSLGRWSAYRFLDKEKESEQIVAEKNDKEETEEIKDIVQEDSKESVEQENGIIEENEILNETDMKQEDPEVSISEKYLSEMTIEQKVAQLFIITPEALTGIENVTAAGEATYAALNQYPVGGLVYFDNNLQSYEQISSMLHTIQQYSTEITGLPLFLAVDEEGGSVARISGRIFGVDGIEDMAVIGASQNYSRAQETGSYIGGYLSELGFNVDFAPCADVLTNPENTVVALRSFGSDASIVADMVKIQLNELEKCGIFGVPKHFPGHGATSEDSHNGYAYIHKTQEELDTEEWIPFKKAIDNNARFMMVGHIVCPQITGDEVPASMSYKMVTEILRGTLGFDGLVVTDALNMGAIMTNYSSDTAAVTAILAGVDLLLMPTDFQSAYQGVLNAVYNGEISEDRINKSVRKIIQVKNEIRIHH